MFQLGSASGLPDGSLLDRFLNGGPDEAEVAFAVLVERHGPMVMQVCRRILGDRHDAEDAAQAAFLVLARQARSIRRMDSVASWLYGVAARVAARARRDAERRRVRERRSVEAAMAIRRAAGDDPGVLHVLHEELDRLPERFRLPILLCHLEGLTYEQAAQQLGCPIRTVQSRLARARKRLRDRLTRRGVSPAVAPPVAVLNPDAASAFLSERWKQATVQAAVRYATSGAQAAFVSATVVALAEGALRAMILHSLMKWVAFLSLIGLAASGAGIAIFARSTPAQAVRPNPGVPDDNRFRVTMAGSVTIEVVAVSTVPTGPDTWWKPDGSRLAEPPVDAIQPKTGAHEGKVARVILVRASGVKSVDMFRWNPTPSASYWGGRPKKGGQDVPGLEYYEAAFPRDQADCGVRAKVAAGAWKTEVSNDGSGGTGMFVNGHKFSFGKARPLSAYGRSMTVFSVAHNFFGQDRRLVAIDRDGKAHAAVSYSLGSDGDKRWVIDLIDAEFSLPPEQIREYQVQFRPIEEAEIGAIALNPRPAEGKPTR